MSHLPNPLINLYEIFKVLEKLEIIFFSLCENSIYFLNHFLESFFCTDFVLLQN